MMTEAGRQTLDGVVLKCSISNSHVVFHCGPSDPNCPNQDNSSLINNSQRTSSSQGIERQVQDENSIAAGATMPPPPKRVRKQQTVTPASLIERNGEPIEDLDNQERIKKSVTPPGKKMTTRYQKGLPKGKDEKEAYAPSNLDELKKYAKQECSTKKYNRKYLKLHVIMNYAEMRVYENDIKKASQFMTKFYKQMKGQSNTSTQQLAALVEAIPQKKNPVRAALFHAASACKEIKDNPDFKSRSFYVSQRIYEIYSLVLGLTKGKAAEVLDFNLLKNDVGPVVIAKFLLSIMYKLYDRGCADDKDGIANQTKAYALKWIAIGFSKVKDYTKAINLINKKRSDYDGITNESIDIYGTLGLCLKEKGKYVEALSELQKANSLALGGVAKPSEATLKYLNKEIETVKKLLLTKTSRKVSTNQLA